MIAGLTMDDPDPSMIEKANANKRHHWTVQRRVTQYWRTYARAAARGPWTMPDTHRWPVRVTVTIRWPDSRRRDPSNWAPLGKAVIDGLTDAGWWPDDDSRHVIGPDLRRDPENGPHRVVVHIEELSEVTP